ncbi:hypothetical protein BAVI_00045, partial [Neobacillus vireti LMG 21834]
MTAPSVKSGGRAQSAGDFDRSFGKIGGMGTIDGGFRPLLREIREEISIGNDVAFEDKGIVK